jgi:hypothetical protein
MYACLYKFWQVPTMDTKVTQKKTNALSFKDPNQENLHWHDKLGHLSHTRIQQLTKIGILSKYLNLKQPPICIVCIIRKRDLVTVEIKGNK